MKRVRVLYLVLFSALILAVLPTHAAQLSWTSYHELTASLTPLNGGGALNPYWGTIHTDVYGTAYHNPLEPWIVVTNVLPIPPPGSVSSSLPISNWMVTNSSTMAYVSGSSFTAANTLRGNAPSPSILGAADGYLSQNVHTYFQLFYDIKTDGLYVATVSDFYDLYYTLTGNTTDGNFFNMTHGFARIEMSVAKIGGGSPLQSFYPLLTESGDHRYSTPVPDFSVLLDDQVGQTSVEFMGIAGETVLFAGYVYEFYEGNTNNVVPLPSTLLLLGSGLLGLAGLRRFRKQRKGN